MLDAHPALRQLVLAAGLAVGALVLPIPLVAGVAHAADDLATVPPSPVLPPPSADPRVTPEPSGSPDPSPDPTPSPSPDPTPSPTPTPSPLPSAPAALNLFVATGFRYQDPNYTACTATSVMDMLNFIALRHTGGDALRWQVSLSGTMRDTVLHYERDHDTAASSAKGSDPHGWRNALNYFGWGANALKAGQRVYEDQSFSSFTTAIRTAVRQMVLTRKPVGILGWGGKHAQMLTGYHGLRGSPLARNADGSWANTFTVDGVYVTDPLRADALVNHRVSLSELAGTSDYRLRLRPYLETDSPYDDPYTPGYRISRTEWYARYTLVLPQR